MANALHNFLPKRTGFTVNTFLGPRGKKISKRSKCVSEQHRVRARQAWVCIHHLQAVGPWASSFTSLSLSFPVLTGKEETRLSSVYAKHLALHVTHGGMLQIWCLFLICLHFLLFPCPRTWASASISFLTMAGKKGGVSLGFSGKRLPELTLEYCTPPLQSTGEGAKG